MEVINQGILCGYTPASFAALYLLLSLEFSKCLKAEFLCCEIRLSCDDAGTASPRTTMNESEKQNVFKPTIPQRLLHLSRRTIHQRCNYGSDHKPPMSVESAYRVLNLEPGASMDSVKAAYRRLALKSHPDLSAKDGAEFLRISAAYQRILNKNVIYDTPRATRARYNADVRAYPGVPVRPFNRTAVTVWGLGLAMGCVLFGAVLLWSRVESSGSGVGSLKGPSRVIEPSSNAVKRERIAALLLEKSRPRKDGDR